MFLLEAISEIQDALIYCEREYYLYPEPEMRDLMATLYFEAISFFELGAQYLASSFIFWLARSQMLKHESRRIIKLSKKIVREAEYFNRREVREISHRMLEANRKQEQIIKAVEGQQRIIESLQEEQKGLASVADHQQVLQALQKLLANFPPSLTNGSPWRKPSVEEVEDAGDD